MARTAITLRTFTGESTTPLADPTGDTIDQANGMNLALASGAIPSAPGMEKLVFRVHNSAASPANFIVRAGAEPPANQSLAGDLTVSVTNATIKWFGPFHSGRFVQSDGSVNVDFGSGFTGDITAFVLPHL